MLPAPRSKLSMLDSLPEGIDCILPSRLLRISPVRLVNLAALASARRRAFFFCCGEVLGEGDG